MFGPSSFIPPKASRQLLLVGYYPASNQKDHGFKEDKKASKVDPLWASICYKK